MKALARQVHAGALPRPRAVRYDFADTHWRHIERFGEYRDDVARAERAAEDAAYER